MRTPILYPRLSVTTVLAANTSAPTQWQRSTPPCPGGIGGDRAGGWDFYHIPAVTTLLSPCKCQQRPRVGTPNPHPHPARTSCSSASQDSMEAKWGFWVSTCDSNITRRHYPSSPRYGAKRGLNVNQTLITEWQKCPRCN